VGQRSSSARARLRRRGLVLVMAHRLLPLGLCDCGTSTSKRCADFYPPEVTMIPCSKFRCSVDCGAHRHAPGSLGYPTNTTFSATWIREIPVRQYGLWLFLRTWVCAVFVNIFYTAQMKANRVLVALHRTQFPPPTPLPTLVLSIDGHVFTCVDGKMVRQ